MHYKPMPDYMGFGRRQITDMLPEEIAEAEMDAMRKYVQKETMGLREYTCAECGRAFAAYSEHRYKRTGKGKAQRMYCSYTCFRTEEKRDEEAYRARRLNAWAGKAEKTPEERAKERVKYCKAKLKKAKEKKTGEGWATATYKQKKQILMRIASWEAKLLVAELELEEARKGADAT